MMNTKKPKVTKAELKRKLLEAIAGQAHTSYFASIEIDKGSQCHMMASGVILTITALGGREIIKPTLIRDGLSPESVAAIKRDLKRSFELATRLNPTEVK